MARWPEDEDEEDHLTIALGASKLTIAIGSRFWERTRSSTGVFANTLVAPRATKGFPLVMDPNVLYIMVK